MDDRALFISKKIIQGLSDETQERLKDESTLSQSIIAMSQLIALTYSVRPTLAARFETVFYGLIDELMEVKECSVKTMDQ